jgi:hypothetical protein
MSVGQFAASLVGFELNFSLPQTGGVGAAVRVFFKFVTHDRGKLGECFSLRLSVANSAYGKN